MQCSNCGSTMIDVLEEQEELGPGIYEIETLWVCIECDHEQMTYRQVNEDGEDV